MVIFRKYGLSYKFKYIQNDVEMNVKCIIKFYLLVDYEINRMNI